MLRAGRGRYSARAALRRRSLVWPEVGGDGGGGGGPGSSGGGAAMKRDVRILLLGEGKAGRGGGLLRPSGRPGARRVPPGTGRAFACGGGRGERPGLPVAPVPGVGGGGAGGAGDVSPTVDGGSALRPPLPAPRAPVSGGSCGRGPCRGLPPAPPGSSPWANQAEEPHRFTGLRPEVSRRTRTPTSPSPSDRAALGPAGVIEAGHCPRPAQALPSRCQRLPLLS